MPFNKLNGFTFNHKDQQDELYKTMDPEQVKTAFDSRAEEVRIVLNELITELETKGASSIGATGGNVQALLTSLKTLLDNTVIRTTDLEDAFSQFTLSDGNSNPEIVLARTDSVTGTVYSLIADRLRVMDTRTTENTTSIGTINSNINAINTNANTANGRITTNTNNITAANTRIDTTNNNVAAANARIDVANVNIAAAQKQINQSNIGQRQYVKFFAAGDRVQIAYKYVDENSLLGRSGEDAIIEFGVSSGVNRLFQILRFWKKANNNFFPDSNLASYSPWFECNGDVVGPVIARAAANGNANASMYTGGAYGFSGLNTGTATARQVSFEVYADGRKLSAGEEVYADVVLIRSIQRIQGFNTKVSAGGGREILQQTTNYQVIDGCIEIGNNLTALEALTIDAYYGLQFPWDSTTPYLNGTIHYVNGDVQNGNARKQLTTTAEHNAGVKTTYTMATRFTLKSPTDNHIVNAWIDESFGLGLGNNVSSAVSRMFSQPGRTYMSMVYGVEKPMAINETISWRGGVSLFKNTARTADVLGKMTRNNKVWTFIDFLTSGTESVVVQPETMFYVDYKTFSKTNGIDNPVNNYTTRTVLSNGYGQIIYRFDKG